MWTKLYTCMYQGCRQYGARAALAPKVLSGTLDYDQFHVIFHNIILS